MLAHGRHTETNPRSPGHGDCRDRETASEARHRAFEFAQGESRRPPCGGMAEVSGTQAPTLSLQTLPLVQAMLEPGSFSVALQIFGEQTRCAEKAGADVASVRGMVKADGR